MNRLADNNPQTNDKTPPYNRKNRLIWSAIFVVIAVATIWTVVSESKNFSFSAFLSYINHSSKIWLLVAFLGMLGFIVFEGESVLCICRAFGYNKNHGKGFVYSASDIYFSAITPSATGGQPVCAFFMIKDGIPGTVTTVVLLANLAMYTLAVVVISVFSILIRPTILLSFNPVSQTLIYLGFIVQLLLVVFLLMLLFKADILHKVCYNVLHFLCKIKIIKHENERADKLSVYMQGYAECARMIKDHKQAMVKAFIFNILQRLSIISVSVFVFLASGGNTSVSFDIFGIQCCSIIGSNIIPIPGAMGVSDFIMIDGFSKFMRDPISFELLCRSISFYICVIICGITVLIKYWTFRKRGKQI